MCFADDQAVVAEIPTGPVIVVEDGAKAERMSVGRIAADGEGQENSAVLERKKPRIHFSVRPKVAHLVVAMEGAATVSGLPEHHPIALVAAFLFEALGSSGDVPVWSGSVDTYGVEYLAGSGAERDGLREEPININPTLRVWPQCAIPCFSSVS